MKVNSFQRDAENSVCLVRGVRMRFQFVVAAL